VKNAHIDQDWLENTIAKILRNQFEEMAQDNHQQQWFDFKVKETALVIAGVIKVELEGDNEEEY
jgi:hypothetical protein